MQRRTLVRVHGSTWGRRLAVASYAQALHVLHVKRLAPALAAGSGDSIHLLLLASMDFYCVDASLRSHCRQSCGQRSP